MAKSFTILIVGPDRTLPREIDAALASIEGMRAVTHYVPDYRQGIESARSRRPDIAIVEMGADHRGLKMFVEETRVGSPETSIVAAFMANVLAGSNAESEILIKAVRMGVQDFLRRPVSSAELEQYFDRLTHRPTPNGQLGRICTFFANKGGVGKSSLSVNVASMLATHRPGRVLLVDASLQMGVCASMLDMQPKTTITDAARERLRLDETLIRELACEHNSGLHLLAAPATAVEAAEIDDEIIARILTLARRTYDFVIVDTFPMLDSVMMSILDLTDRAYLVTESVVPTLRGAAVLLETLNEIGLPEDRRKIVLNRFSKFSGNLRPQDVSARLGQPVTHIVPYQKKLLIAANEGVPFVLGIGRGSDFSKAVAKIVDEIDSEWSPRAAPASSLLNRPSKRLTGQQPNEVTA